MPVPIDVWNMETFDPELASLLTRNAELIRAYMLEDQKIFLDYDLGRHPSRRQMFSRPKNVYAADFIPMRDAIGREMESRTIRAWHYTRLADAEVETIRNDGIHLSTPDTLQKRLAAMTESGHFTPEISRRLHEGSPFHSDQMDARANKFWMVSHPLPVADSLVSSLLSHWGGEVTYFWLRDDGLQAKVRSLGMARVLELAVPLACTRHSHSAGTAVVGTFGRALGCVSEKHCFDLYTIEPLAAAAVLAVHSEGEADFDQIGRSFPRGFVDVNVGYWKALTGEDG